MIDTSSYVMLDIDWSVCIYCGDPQTEKDHYPPVSRKDDYRAIGGKVFVIVPSCTGCNAMLNNTLTETFIERKMTVNALIRQRFNNELSNSKWTLEEIEELDGMIKQTVLAGDRIARWLTARLEYTNGIQTYMKWDDTAKLSLSLLRRFL